MAGRVRESRVLAEQTRPIIQPTIARVHCLETNRQRPVWLLVKLIDSHQLIDLFILGCSVLLSIEHVFLKLTE